MAVWRYGTSCPCLSPGSLGPPLSARKRPGSRSLAPPLWAWLGSCRACLGRARRARPPPLWPPPRSPGPGPPAHHRWRWKTWGPGPGRPRVSLVLLFPGPPGRLASAPLLIFLSILGCVWFIFYCPVATGCPSCPLFSETVIL